MFGAYLVATPPDGPTHLIGTADLILGTFNLGVGYGALPDRKKPRTNQWGDVLP